MKKLLSFALLLFSLSAFSQTLKIDTAENSSHGFYISPGIGYSAQQVGYSLEGGYWNEDVWFGATVSTSKDLDSNHYTTYAGGKIYYKIVKATKKIDLFAYTGLYVGLIKKAPLQLEPGFSTVLYLNDKWALQWSISTPLYEHAYEVNPATSLSVNFYF